MDPATLLSLAGSLKGLGGGGSKSQSSSSNSLAVNTSTNVGVNPLFGVSAGGSLDNLTAGSAGLTAGTATASSSSTPSQGGEGSGYPGYSVGYPAVDDIDQTPVGGSILDGVADLFTSPVMLLGLGVGAYFLLADQKG